MAASQDLLKELENVQKILQTNGIDWLIPETEILNKLQQNRESTTNPIGQVSSKIIAHKKMPDHGTEEGSDLPFLRHSNVDNTLLLRDTIDNEPARKTTLKIYQTENKLHHGDSTEDQNHQISKKNTSDTNVAAHINQETLKLDPFKSPICYTSSTDNVSENETQSIRRPVPAPRFINRESGTLRKSQNIHQPQNIKDQIAEKLIANMELDSHVRQDVTVRQTIDDYKDNSERLNIPNSRLAELLKGMFETRNTLQYPKKPPDNRVHRYGKEIVDEKEVTFNDQQGISNTDSVESSRNCNAFQRGQGKFNPHFEPQLSPEPNKSYSEPKKTLQSFRDFSNNEEHQIKRKLTAETIFTSDKHKEESAKQALFKYFSQLQLGKMNDQLDPDTETLRKLRYSEKLPQNWKDKVATIDLDVFQETCETDSDEESDYYSADDSNQLRNIFNSRPNPGPQPPQYDVNEIMRKLRQSSAIPKHRDYENVNNMFQTPIYSNQRETESDSTRSFVYDPIQLQDMADFQQITASKNPPDMSDILNKLHDSRKLSNRPDRRVCDKDASNVEFNFHSQRSTETASNTDILERLERVKSDLKEKSIEWAIPQIQNQFQRLIATLPLRDDNASQKQNSDIDIHVHQDEPTCLVEDSVRQKIVGRNDLQDRSVIESTPAPHEISEEVYSNSSTSAQSCVSVTSENEEFVEQLRTEATIIQKIVSNFNIADILAYLEKYKNNTNRVRIVTDKLKQLENNSLQKEELQTDDDIAPLVTIFPDADLAYLKRLHSTLHSLDTIVEKLLETPDYPRRSIPSTNQITKHERPPLRTLFAVLPQADPDFLVENWFVLGYNKNSYQNFISEQLQEDRKTGLTESVPKVQDSCNRMSDDDNFTRELMNEERIKNSKREALYKTLIAMIPEADPQVLHEACVSIGDDENAIKLFVNQQVEKIRKEAQCKTLIAMFPDVDSQILRDACNIIGDDENAMKMFVNEQTLKNKREAQCKKLIAMFPEADPQTVREMYNSLREDELTEMLMKQQQDKSKMEDLCQNLVAMFPFADPKLLRERCLEIGSDEKALRDFITEQSFANDVNERYQDLRDQLPDIDPDFLRDTLKILENNVEAAEMSYETLTAIFPDADPEYLLDVYKELGNDINKINAFIMETKVAGEYPKMNDYLNRQEKAALKKKYKEEFNIEDFLDNIPDPFEYFIDKGNRVNDERGKRFSMAFLEKRYKTIPMEDILAAFEEENHVLTSTCLHLDCWEGRQEPERKSFTNTVPEDENIPVSFLQEVAFIENRFHIKKVVDEKKERKRIALEEAEENGMLLECPICTEMSLYEDTSMSMEGHIFCKTCIRRGAESEIGNGRTKVMCLDGCGAEFSMEVLQTVLKEVIFNRLLQRKQLEEIEAARIEGLESCPFCNYASIPPEGDKIFRCLNPECMQDTCRTCHKLNHLPLKCDETETQDQVKMRTYIEDKMTEALVRSCWRCSKKFVKEEGCNRMTCPCGAMMCYLCRQPVSDYSHFNGPGGDAIEKCELFSEMEVIHDDVVKKVGIDAKDKILHENPNLVLEHDPTSILEGT